MRLVWLLFQTILKFFRNTLLRDIFSTLSLVFRNVCKHGLVYLIYYVWKFVICIMQYTKIIELPPFIVGGNLWTDCLFSFVGVEGNFSVQISEQDHIGPLKNKPVEDRDYYLLFSVLFLVAFSVFMFAKSSYRQLVWDRIQAVPWRRFLQYFRREKQD